MPERLTAAERFEQRVRFYMEHPFRGVVTIPIGSNAARDEALRRLWRGEAAARRGAGEE